jgi:hypothetical protein
MQSCFGNLYAPGLTLRNELMRGVASCRKNLFVERRNAMCRSMNLSLDTEASRAFDKKRLFGRMEG